MEVETMTQRITSFQQFKDLPIGTVIAYEEGDRRHYLMYRKLTYLESIDTSEWERCYLDRPLGGGRCLYVDRDFDVVMYAVLEEEEIQNFLFPHRQETV